MWLMVQLCYGHRPLAYGTGSIVLKQRQNANFTLFMNTLQSVLNKTGKFQHQHNIIGDGLAHMNSQYSFITNSTIVVIICSVFLVCATFNVGLHYSESVPFIQCNVTLHTPYTHFLFPVVFRNVGDLAHSFPPTYYTAIYFPFPPQSSLSSCQIDKINFLEFPISCMHADC